MWVAGLVFPRWHDSWRGGLLWNFSLACTFGDRCTGDTNVSSRGRCVNSSGRVCLPLPIAVCLSQCRYLLFFSVIIVALEVKSMLCNKFLARYIEEYASCLTTLRGRGVFYLLVGGLSIGQWRVSNTSSDDSPPQSGFWANLSLCVRQTWPDLHLTDRHAPASVAR